MGLFSTVPDCTRLYLALPWSALINHSTDCHILPLTGLNAVYTGLNAQKWDGWMDMGLSFSSCTQDPRILGSQDPRILGT